MQCQWTMEVRADFADADKKKVLTEALQNMAAQVYAKLHFLKDHQQPEVALFSDDFFEGPEEIALIAKKQGLMPDDNVNTQTDDADAISDELMEASRTMRTSTPKP